MNVATKKLSWVCAFFGASSPLSIALIAPALPAISDAILVNTKEVQFSTSIYLYCFGVSQLFVYLLVRRLGENLTLKIGSLLYLLATLLMFLYAKLELLYLVRALQALSAAILVVSSRALIRNQIDKEFISRAFFISGIGFSLSPILGPPVSAFLTSEWGWQSPFFVQLLFGTILFFLSVFYVPVSDKLTQQTISRFHIKDVILDKIFIKFTLVATLSFSGLFSFTVLGPFVFEQDLKLPGYLYGYIAPFSALGYLIVSVLNLFMPDISAFKSPFLTGLCALIISALALSMSIFTGEMILELTGFILSAFLWNVGCACIFPASLTICLEKYNNDASKAVSVFGFLQFVLSSLATFVVSLMNFSPIYTLAFVYVFLAVAIVIIFSLNLKNKEVVN